MAPFAVLVVLLVLAGILGGLAWRAAKRAVAASLIAEIAETMTWIEAHGSGCDEPVSSTVYRTFHSAVPLLGSHLAREVAGFHAAAALLRDHLRSGGDDANEAGDKDTLLRKGAETLQDLRAVLSPRRGITRA